MIVAKLDPALLSAFASVIMAGLALVGVLVNYIRSASSVGLGYLEKALAAQETRINNQNSTISEQQKEIGRLSGQLVECREERQRMSDKQHEQETHILTQDRRIAELEARLA